MAKCRLWVYNAEILFVASGHAFAPVIQPTKRNSKKRFLGHPSVGDMMMMISQFYNREGRALDKLSFSSILLNCFNKNHSIYGIFGNLPHC